jgi:hypothetical protein
MQREPADEGPRPVAGGHRERPAAELTGHATAHNHTSYRYLKCE